MRTVALTERQAAVLAFLKSSRTLTAAQAGEHLLANGLLNTRGTPSNYSLPGAAVLQSLVDRKLAMAFWDRTSGRSIYRLTTEGETKASDGLTPS